MYKIKIDEKIISNLKYYQDIKLIKKFLSLINRNNEIVIRDESTIDDLGFKINKISYPDASSINMKNFNKIKVYYEDERLGEKVQMVDCDKLLYTLFSGFLNIKNKTKLKLLISVFLGLYVFESLVKNENLKVLITEEALEHFIPDNFATTSDSSLYRSKYVYDNINSINFFDIIKNVNVFVVFYKNKIFARSLLWNTDKGLYLDKCYIANDILEYGFYAYAEKYYNIKLNYLKNSEYPMKVKIGSDEINNLVKFFVKNQKTKVPYMDTFKFFDLKNDQIILTNVDTGTHYMRLDYYIKSLSYKKDIEIEIHKSDSMFLKLLDESNLQIQDWEILYKLFDVHIINIKRGDSFAKGFMIKYNVHPLFENKKYIWWIIFTKYNDEFFVEFVGNNINKYLKKNNYFDFEVENYFTSNIFNDTDSKFISFKYDFYSESIKYLAYVKMSYKSFYRFVNAIKNIRDTRIQIPFRRFVVTYNPAIDTFIMHLIPGTTLSLKSSLKYREIYKSISKIFGEYEDVKEVKNVADIKDALTSNKNTLICFDNYSTASSFIDEI